MHSRTVPSTPAEKRCGILPVRRRVLNRAFPDHSDPPPGCVRTKEPAMERYICIHGHFYQPPRENPWLEAIQLQDSAAPYHDWNERITAECYAPNTAARILDGQGHIVKIVNNYARISFNFGPTLLSWLEHQT